MGKNKNKNNKPENPRLPYTIAKIGNSEKSKIDRFNLEKLNDLYLLNRDRANFMRILSTRTIPKRFPQLNLKLLLISQTNLKTNSSRRNQ